MNELCFFRVSLLLLVGKEALLGGRKNEDPSLCQILVSKTIGQDVVHEHPLMEEGELADNVFVVEVE